jgi:hypothetical protein
VGQRKFSGEEYNKSRQHKTSRSFLIHRSFPSFILPAFCVDENHDRHPQPQRSVVQPGATLRSRHSRSRPGTDRTGRWLWIATCSPDLADVALGQLTRSPQGRFDIGPRRVSVDARPASARQIPMVCDAPARPVALPVFVRAQFAARNSEPAIMDVPRKQLADWRMRSPPAPYFYLCVGA